MRTLEFRTEAVLDEQGGLAQFCTAFDAMADLKVIMTRDEAQELAAKLLIIYDPEKEFSYFTLRGAGRGIRSD